MPQETRAPAMATTPASRAASPGPVLPCCTQKLPRCLFLSRPQAGPGCKTSQPSCPHKNSCSASAVFTGSFPTHQAASCTRACRYPYNHTAPPVINVHLHQLLAQLCLNHHRCQDYGAGTELWRVAPCEQAPPPGSSRDRRKGRWIERGDGEEGRRCRRLACPPTVSLPSSSLKPVESCLSGPVYTCQRVRRRDQNCVFHHECAISPYKGSYESIYTFTSIPSPPA